MNTPDCKDCFHYRPADARNLITPNAADYYAECAASPYQYFCSTERNSDVRDSCGSKGRNFEPLIELRRAA